MGGIQRRARSTSIPVEWICWLNGQGKVAPTPEEMMELEARCERVRLNVALLKKEEEERKAREGNKKAVSSGKVGGPDLKSFIRQFQSASKGEKVERESDERWVKYNLLSCLSLRLYLYPNPIPMPDSPFVFTTTAVCIAPATVVLFLFFVYLVK
ncbi:uncharacterized protein LOC120202406 [Hibiscus syriacus]|uniref:uncharacterized protein LOC120202406 n=1 Tax=Hibiscus syriacus TaxID=106335 RepID=UPI001924F3A1|nr:uncharacterized protein LOC120202406 [Hibiscus syriacus]